MTERRVSAMVTVYTTGPGCIRCKMTKEVMAKKGVRFVEVDIRQNAAAREYVTEDLGYSEAPVCVVEDGTGEDHWSGFRPDLITRLATATGREM
ncbi:glutaredoxin family protein [Arthrobacter liuii]|uniref:glutaredoxin family protein n=1 Tax=Arthrobacter liuii TaxID=1476996 RepID=UPI0035E5B7D9